MTFHVFASQPAAGGRNALFKVGGEIPPTAVPLFEWNSSVEMTHSVISAL